mmetsp:Transcript_13261/g.22800  ORF Transcript_13261/g.22800 Transcript_13261/m.22800 type:complete len:93 (-) Transcript_13261:84-362(-)
MVTNDGNGDDDDDGLAEYPRRAAQVGLVDQSVWTQPGIHSSLRSLARTSADGCGGWAAHSLTHRIACSLSQAKLEKLSRLQFGEGRERRRYQ